MKNLWILLMGLFGHKPNEQNSIETNNIKVSDQTSTPTLECADNRGLTVDTVVIEKTPVKASDSIVTPKVTKKTALGALILQRHTAEITAGGKKVRFVTHAGDVRSAKVVENDGRGTVMVRRGNDGPVFRVRLVKFAA